MEGSFLPPGFRFHPNDVELLEFYLKRKIMGIPFDFEAISELDLYKFPPWDLPQKSNFKSIDLEWYFFCPRSKKHGGSSRMNRANDVGYWKVSGRDRIILRNNQLLGMKKILVFYVGKAPRGERTNWVMHEYRLGNKDLCAGLELDAYVICRVFQKEGPGSRNDAQNREIVEEKEMGTGEDIVNYGLESSSDLIPPLSTDNVFEPKTKAYAEESILSNLQDGFNQDLSKLGTTGAGSVRYSNGAELYKDLDDLGFFSGENQVFSNNQSSDYLLDQVCHLPEDDFLTGYYDNSINFDESYDPILNNNLLLPGFDAMPKENTAKGGTIMPNDKYGFNDHSEVYPKDYITDTTSSNGLNNAPWEASKTNEGSKNKLSSLILQSFWDSIPARAASAVEYPIHTSPSKSVTSPPKKGLARRASCSRPAQHEGRFGFVLGLAVLAIVMWFGLLLVSVKLGLFVCEIPQNSIRAFRSFGQTQLSK